MVKTKFLKLVSKKFSKGISESDAGILRDLEANSEELQVLSDRLTLYFKEENEYRPRLDKLSDTWDKISTIESNNFQGKFNYSPSIRIAHFYSNLIKVAAVLLLFTCTGSLAYFLLKREKVIDSIVINATKQKIYRRLDDGTRVWLNKESSIKYNKDFGVEQREIFLDGEAYFDVTKNSAVPLFVHVRGIDIEVKGTAFNINAYNKNNEIQVALIRGAIQITDRLDKKRMVLLKPNQKLIYANSGTGATNGEFLIVPVSPNLLKKETKWILDTLTFRKEKLKDLALRMEKKYNIKIKIQTEQVREKRFSGTFTNETIQQALEALKLSYPLTYTINNNIVVIKN
ncbi:hypothetical protein ADIARSV_1722 [Arcticibacter svalbardensis MN12-7]|uniref:Anti-sigma factor n=1 Tax=Arcticibacter svalbardensis MN12-7 TaxID=1150600 RepID=R9H212_9SPHI|nr:FecR family protein [Arcticibacter svalbardensis]EOR95234.1 hypothetical protein ADIARSV_1722 [Arcticibacter svalbardensis MN12-7]